MFLLGVQNAWVSLQVRCDVGAPQEHNGDDDSDSACSAS
jgi:hypothetical protein